MSVVLGLSAYHGDAAAALVVDGRLVAAAAEERFTRIRHCAGFPREAARACLAMAGIDARDVTRFAVGRDPRAHLWKKALFALARRPGWGLIADRARNRRAVGDAAQAIGDALGLGAEGVRQRLRWVEHHPAHLASAYLASPFEEAAACAIDGFGDFVSTSWAHGRGSRLDVLRRLHFPHSLGLLYLAVTQHLGFPRYGDEYKVMGLASYGLPEQAPLLRRLLRLEPDGGFRLDLAYFRHAREGTSMTWADGEPAIGPVGSPRLAELLGPARRPEDPLTARHQALAASLQAVFEEAVFHVLGALQRRTGLRRLCLAGGCAMNSVANGKIRERTGFADLYVQPAAGDDGTALGAALHAAHEGGAPPPRFAMTHGYWGPEFDDGAVDRALDASRAALAAEGCQVREFPDDESLGAHAAERLADGQVLGWFQGRMEWGPRALGNRSILADPRRADMRETLNARIKLRESFRPLAPSLLEEALGTYFADAVPDPFMVEVHPVRPDKRAEIPAVTHVDGSGRPHTVTRDANPRFWQLLMAFARRTGVPVLLNTSFNENEPIVHRPEEAIACFLRTRMDGLVVGRRAITKRDRS